MPNEALATSDYLNRPLRRIEDARIAAAASLLPIAKALGEMAKAQADSIDRTERRFGAPAIMDLAKLLDDVWMACDNLVTDIPELRAQMNQETTNG